MTAAVGAGVVLFKFLGEDTRRAFLVGRRGAAQDAMYWFQAGVVLAWCSMNLYWTVKLLKIALFDRKKKDVDHYD